MNTKFNLLNKVLFLAVLATFFAISPKTTKAFDIGQLFDPACIFLCSDDKPAPKPAPEPALGVSCYTNYSSGYNGDTVTWVASVYGGNGNYRYSWSGTDGLYGNGQSASIIYRNSGSKTAYVTVSSGSQSVSKMCNSINIIEKIPTPVYKPPVYHTPPPVVKIDKPADPTLSATCYSNYTVGNVGDSFTWVATAYGGNGSYSYVWTGTDGLYGGGPSAYITYRTGGSKTASVTVTSNGQSITKNCNGINIYSNTPVPNPTPTPTPVGLIYPVYTPVSNLSNPFTITAPVSVSNPVTNTVSNLSNPVNTNTVTNTVTNSNPVNVSVSTPVNVNVVNNNYSPGGTGYITSGTQTPIYNYDNNTSTSLSVTCYSTYTSANIGDNVTWRAVAYGGNGSYNITWTGTNGLSGSGSSVSMQYTSGGTKTASVSVTSGSQTISKNCNSIEVYDPNLNNQNNYNNNNNSNNYGSLGVSCYANYTTGNVGGSITWIASVYGGNGNYYISWTGTDGLYGTGSSVSMNYNYPGTKSASVTVTSNGQSISRNCSTVQIYDSGYNNNQSYYGNNYYGNNNNYNGNYNIPLTVSCSPSVTFAQVGTRVTWRAYPSGGNGNYVYQWYGSDSVSGNGNSIELFYNSPGVKTASVTVSSNGQSISQNCANTVTVGTPNNTYSNNYYPTQAEYTPTKTVVKYVQVPAKSPVVVASPTPTPAPTGATVASLFSISNVPWGWVSFMVILVLIFTIFYLVFNKNKI